MVRLCLQMADNAFQPQQQWNEIVSINLLCAYITKYVPGTDEPRFEAAWEILVRFGVNVTSIDNYLNGVICFRSCGFEVINMDGVTTGAVQVDNTRLQGEWLQKISTTIGNINCNYVKKYHVQPFTTCVVVRLAIFLINYLAHYWT